MSSQKGFIQIPLLIIAIILIITASAGTGVILYKQHKARQLTANISEALNQPQNTTTIERIEKTQTTQEELSQQQKDLEQVKLEAEKTKAEAEKARLEAEKLRKELQQAHSQITTTTQSTTSQIVLDPLITNVSPSQILNNIVNYLTIAGSNFTEGANIIIGGVNLGNGSVIDGKIITISISAGILPPNTYSVQIVNPDGKTAISNNSLIIISPPTQIVATTTDQDRLNAEIKSAATDSLNKEYGLKINILQAKLIDAESISLHSEDDARRILSFCRGGQYPNFATTDNIKEALNAICTGLKENGYNLTSIGIGATTDALRDYIYSLNIQISQLQNELERKLLELEPESLSREYGLKINSMKAQLIETNTLQDSSVTKFKKIFGYYTLHQYPDFADTDYKRQVIDEIYAKLDALNPVGRDYGDVMTFLREHISALNYQINQTYNELQRKLLESQ